MADNFPLTPGSGRNAATDQVTYSGDTADVQLVRLVGVTGSEGSKTVVEPPVSSTYGYAVDVTRMKPDGTNTMPSLDTAARRGYVQVTDGTNTLPIGDVASRAIFVKETDGTLTGGMVDETGTSAVDARAVGGGTPHDSVNSGNPLYLGAEAIAHGTNPTAVAAADRTKLYANRAGVPFVMGGHPNVQTSRTQFTSAQTNVALLTVASGLKIVVTAIQVTLDNASTVFPSVRIGFGTASTPTGAGVIAAHGGVPAGGGFSRGDGSGIIGVGADDEDLRITTVGAATGNGVEVVTTYYTIES